MLQPKAGATLSRVSSDHPKSTDAFALREEELRASHGALSEARSEVRSIPGLGLSPLLDALRSKPSQVAWIASRLASPPLLCLFQALDPHARLRLDIVAPFVAECFPDALSRALASVLERWSQDWQLHLLEGPTYPGHVFIFDKRVLLCRDPLLTSNPSSPDWVNVDLRALPSLHRRLRRRRAACRLLAPGSLEDLYSEISCLPGFPLPISTDEQERRDRLVHLLGDQAGRSNR